MLARNRIIFPEFELTRLRLGILLGHIEESGYVSRKFDMAKPRRAVKPVMGADADFAAFSPPVRAGSAPRDSVPDAQSAIAPP
jgi:hypothetical protein